ncbi:hypothetical protein XPU_0862 [Xanthomonas arboricola pv. pruni str. MAFF 311562]|uniref:Uncharacterized protein n=1 Tax=Xanthomonas arboricola pv. pruni str. MAFF 311562 TaxID=1414836 RepID=W4RY87_9XANT|nr:hypothetical protein XPU_0862 [Xanthomonas arboricola pv. pruni str. MAFF 311562]
MLIAFAALACGHAFAQDSDIRISVEEIGKARAVRRNDGMHGFTLMVKSYQRLVRPKISSIDTLSMEDIHVLFELSAELAFYSNLYKGDSRRKLPPGYESGLCNSVEEWDGRQKAINPQCVKLLSNIETLDPPKIPFRVQE